MKLGFWVLLLTFLTGNAFAETPNINTEVEPELKQEQKPEYCDIVSAKFFKSAGSTARIGNKCMFTDVVFAGKPLSFRAALVNVTLDENNIDTIESEIPLNGSLEVVNAYLFTFREGNQNGVLSDSYQKLIGSNYRGYLNWDLNRAENQINVAGVLSSKNFSLNANAVFKLANSQQTTLKLQEPTLSYGLNYSLQSLRIDIDNRGEGLTRILAPTLFTFIDNPAEQIEQFQKDARLVIASFDDNNLNQASKDSILKLLDDLPSLAARIYVSADFDPPFTMPIFMQTVMEKQLPAKSKFFVFYNR